MALGRGIDEVRNRVVLDRDFRFDLVDQAAQSRAENDPHFRPFVPMLLNNGDRRFDFLVKVQHSFDSMAT